MFSPAAPTVDLPTVRLVLYRILTDENSVEASLIISSQREAFERILKEGEQYLTATLDDGTSFVPSALTNTVRLTAAAAQPGYNYLAVQSERFRLPSSPSMAGFPFDEVQLRVFIDVKGAIGFVRPYILEVQKALPGRLLTATQQRGALVVTLTRTLTEKLLVVISAVMFMSISLLVAGKILRTREGFTGVTEIVAIAGYLVAAAGFREMLGVTRVPGTSALEVITFGIPFICLTLSIIVAEVNKMKTTYEQRHEPPRNTHDPALPVTDPDNNANTEPPATLPAAPPPATTNAQDDTATTTTT